MKERRQPPIFLTPNILTTGWAGLSFVLMVRFSGNPQSIASEVRQAITQLNRSLPIADVNPLSDQVDRSVVRQSLMTQLSSFFALLAVFLACLGL